MGYKVTKIQFFDYTHTHQTGEDSFEDVREYSANIAINDEFMIQLHGNDEGCNYRLPGSDEAFWSTEEAQDSARENLGLGEIVDEIEENGFENNFDWLSENGEKM